MAGALKLPVIDLSASDRISSANSIRQACIECGFFYVVNHGIEEELLDQVFDESSKFFSLPLEDKSKLARKHHRGYTPLYVENLDLEPNSSSTDSSMVLHLSTKKRTETKDKDSLESSFFDDKGS